MFSILIVDDNADLVELFSVVLTRNGYKTCSAVSGEECLKLLKISTPDLILLDIMMDPMDGWETLTGIRSDRMSQSLPVIMVTGKQPDNVSVCARQLLRKPIFGDAYCKVWPTTPETNYRDNTSDPASGLRPVPDDARTSAARHSA